MIERGLAPKASLATAQALTLWALLLHLLTGEISLFTVAFAVTATTLPLRHDGSDRSRARACWGSSLVLGSLLGFDLMAGLWGGSIQTHDVLLLVATVLFSLAGGLFWVRDASRDGDSAVPGYNWS